VERRDPQHGRVPQHDRAAHRDDRQPDADADPARDAAAAAFRRSGVPDRAAGMAFPAVDRLLDLAQPRRARLRGAHAREPALQHPGDGAALDPPGQRGHVDAQPETVRGGGRTHGRRRRKRRAANRIRPARTSCSRRSRSGRT
jgi:hypothetical protein